MDRGGPSPVVLGGRRSGRARQPSSKLTGSGSSDDDKAKGGASPKPMRGGTGVGSKSNAVRAAVATPPVAPAPSSGSARRRKASTRERSDVPVDETGEVVHKGTWTKEEDAILKEMVRINGAKLWGRVAASIPGRTAKQCRERWVNNLDPQLKKTPWSPEEDAILVAKQKEIGNHWSEIAQFLPGRPDNSVKNRWYCMINRSYAKNRRQNRAKARKESKQSSAAGSDSDGVVLPSGRSTTPGTSAGSDGSGNRPSRPVRPSGSSRRAGSAVRPRVAATSMGEDVPMGGRRQLPSMTRGDAVHKRASPTVVHSVAIAPSPSGSGIDGSMESSPHLDEAGGHSTPVRPRGSASSSGRRAVGSGARRRSLGSSGRRTTAEDDALMMPPPPAGSLASPPRTVHDVAEVVNGVGGAPHPGAHHSGLRSSGGWPHEHGALPMEDGGLIGGVLRPSVSQGSMLTALSDSAAEEMFEGAGNLGPPVEASRSDDSDASDTSSGEEQGDATGQHGRRMDGYGPHNGDTALSSRRFVRDMVSALSMSESLEQRRPRKKAFLSTSQDGDDKADDDMDERRDGESKYAGLGIDGRRVRVVGKHSQSRDGHQHSASLGQGGIAAEGADRRRLKRQRAAEAKSSPEAATQGAGAGAGGGVGVESISMSASGVRPSRRALATPPRAPRRRPGAIDMVEDGRISPLSTSGDAGGPPSPLNSSAGSMVNDSFEGVLGWLHTPSEAASSAADSFVAVVAPSMPTSSGPIRASHETPVGNSRKRMAPRSLRGKASHVGRGELDPPAERLGHSGARRGAGSAGGSARAVGGSPDIWAGSTESLSTSMFPPNGSIFNGRGGQRTGGHSGTFGSMDTAEIGEIGAASHGALDLDLSEGSTMAFVREPPAEALAEVAAARAAAAAWIVEAGGQNSAGNGYGIDFGDAPNDKWASIAEGEGSSRSGLSAGAVPLPPVSGAVPNAPGAAIDAMPRAHSAGVEPSPPAASPGTLRRQGGIGTGASPDGAKKPHTLSPVGRATAAY